MVTYKVFRYPTSFEAEERRSLNQWTGSVLFVVRKLSTPYILRPSGYFSDGFGWGYKGAGALELAASIMADYYQERIHERLPNASSYAWFQNYGNLHKFAIAIAPKEGFVITATVLDLLTDAPSFVDTDAIKLGIPDLRAWWKQLTQEVAEGTFVLRDLVARVT